LSTCVSNDAVDTKKRTNGCQLAPVFFCASNLLSAFRPPVRKDSSLSPDQLHGLRQRFSAARNVCSKTFHGRFSIRRQFLCHRLRLWGVTFDTHCQLVPLIQIQTAKIRYSFLRGIIPIIPRNFRSGAFRTFASDNVARFSADSRPRLRKLHLVFCCEVRQISDKLPDACLTFSFYVGNVVVDDRRFGCC